MSRNIAVVVDTLNGGGAEKVCITLVRTLCSLGCQAILVVIKPLLDYELEADFPLHYLLSDKSAKLYRKANIKAAAMELKNLEKKLGGFDLVLSNLDGSHPVVNAAELGNVWYVVHNSIEEKLKRAWRLGPIKYFRQKSIYHCFKHKSLICVSQGLKQEVEDNQTIGAKQVRCIYNPVDIEGLQKGLQEEFIVPDYPYIVHAGRFAKMKRHDVLFDAFSQFKMQTGDSRLKLVLLCENSKKLETSIAKTPFKSDIVVTGFVQNPYPWYQHAELLVLSSEAEGFGMVLVEALLCGTKVVSTDCRHGPNEILTDELVQFLTPVGDAASLAHSIQHALASNPDLTRLEILHEVQPHIAAQRYLELLQYSS